MVKFIIGGAYQGKLEFAKQKYRKEIISDGKSCSIEETFSCEILNSFEALIKRFFSTIQEIITYLDTLLVKNPNIILICNEIGYGIVPIEKSNRLFRELVGRACCEVSKRANTVERVFCGLGVYIKC